MYREKRRCDFLPVFGFYIYRPDTNEWLSGNLNGIHVGMFEVYLDIIKQGQWEVVNA